MTTALTVPALLVAVATPQGPTIDELQRELARAVDLPTAAARLAAADAVVERHPVTVASWSEACAGFGTFAALEPGQSRHTVALQVLERSEPTEVFLYVPESYDPAKPAPLLLWGHGAGGTGAREYLHWQATADRLGMLVLAVTESGKEPGWSSSPRERAAQLGALRWARRIANVDENAVFVGGWSRGGHMTWDLILRHPDLFAGALPCVGGPRLQLGAQNNLRYLENVVALPIRDLQGSQDDPLLLANLRLAFARLTAWKAADARLIEFAELGHSADLGAVDWAQFFTRRRPARPARVVRVAADAAETRAAWVEIRRCDRKVEVDVAPPVDARAWARLDEAGQRALILDKLADYTARLLVVDNGGGRFVAESKNVASFALLLSAAQLGKDGAIEVRWQNRTHKQKVTPSAAVLVRDFVERFDRTRLPVALVVP